MLTEKKHAFSYTPPTNQPKHAHAPVDVPEKVAPQALVKAVGNGVAAAAVSKSPA